MQIDKVADGVYRLSTLVGQKQLSFNQFLIEDEHPALIHTGFYPMYEDVRKAVAEVLDPARLEYIIIPHFEADECGGMGRFVGEAKNAVLVASALGARINLSQWDYSGPVKGMFDGDVLDLGEHRLRFWETPHVHHWDSMMAFDETTKSLFSSDLFIQPGEQPVIVREDLGKEMCKWYREAGLFGGERPVLRVVDRVERLEYRWIHPMHGGSLPIDVVPNYLQALRKEPFVFDGRILGRLLPDRLDGACDFNDSA